MSASNGCFGRAADYEIRSGGGSIAGTVNFVSSKEADRLIKQFLDELDATLDEGDAR